MLIMEGFHWDNYSQEQAIQKFRSWMDFIYHSPFDDINQPINYFAALSHIQIILSTVFIMANHEKEPVWTPYSKYHTIRLQTIAEER